MTDPISTGIPTAVTFQEEANPDTFQAPWPVTFTSEGDVLHGRPDARHIVGFSDPSKPYELALLAIDVTPEKVGSLVGKTPVYVDHQGGMFGIGSGIAEAHVFTGDQQVLAAHGQELVESWKRVSAEETAAIPDPDEDPDAHHEWAQGRTDQAEGGAQ